MRVCLSLAVPLMVVVVATSTLAQPGFSPPPAPQNLGVLFQPAGVYSNIRLAWSAPAGPWFFKIYRAVDDPANFQVLNVTNMLRYEDYHILPGHTYYYTVTSFAVRDSMIVESERSNVDSLTLAPEPDRPRGMISGTVVDSITGVPIPFVRVAFHKRPFVWPWIPQTWTDTAGHYEAVLDTGSYLVNALPWLATAALPQFLPEWYENAHQPSDATPVAVAESSNVTINFDLRWVPPPPTAWMSGTVRDTLGNPLRWAAVYILKTIQDAQAEGVNGVPTAPPNDGAHIEDVGYVRGIVWAGITDSLGEFKARLIAGKRYIALAVRKFYLPEFFSDKSHPAEADLISLRQDTTGIDFTLTPIPAINNSVAGTVRDSLGTGVLARVLLIPKRPQAVPLVVRFVCTDSTGAYFFPYVRAGQYYALAIPFDTYAPAYYKEGSFGVMRWSEADSIVVTGNVANINIGVSQIRGTGLAAVRGRVQASGGALQKTQSLSVAGGNVYLTSGESTIVGYAMTDNDGNYVISNVPSGTYSLVADKEGFRDEFGTVVVSAMDFSVTVPDILLEPQSITSVGDVAGLATEYVLEQNYPNPFNPTTTITYQLPASGLVRLAVYDMLGREVTTLVSGAQEAGTYRVTFDASGLASGMYYYRLQAGSFTDARQMMILK